MKTFLLTLTPFIIWLFLTYASVIIAMATDLVTGLVKSHRLGIKCNSRGLKRTCDKAMKYFMPMICLTCIDLLASVALAAPYLTMIFAAYCDFCELKSVLETTHQKAEITRLKHLTEILATLDQPTLNALLKILNGHQLTTKN